MSEESPNVSTPMIHVADDDVGVRDSLGALFEASEMPCRLYPSGDALLADITPRHSGCILLDYYMPGQDGLATLSALNRAGVNLPVIMITAHGDVGLAVSAMKAGAFDFIEKPWDKDVLLSVVRRALSQESEKRELAEERVGALEALSSFTPRERQVFDQLITGASNKLIARDLELSPRTVEYYRSCVFEKTGANGVAGLVRLAFMTNQMDL